MRARPARLDDVPAMVQGVVDFAAERYPGDAPDREHIAGVIASIMESGSLVLVMDGPGDCFTGCYLGTVVPNMISAKPDLVEIFLWVEPGFRGHGRSLLGYVESWARAQSCASVVLSRPETAERAGRTFQAWGYSPCERHYRKVL